MYKHTFIHIKTTPQPSSHRLFSSRLLFIVPTASVTWQRILTSARFQREHSIHQVKLPKAPLNSHAKQRHIQKPTLALCFYLLLGTILGPPVKARL